MWWGEVGVGGARLRVGPLRDMRCVDGQRRVLRVGRDSFGVVELRVPCSGGICEREVPDARGIGGGRQGDVNAACIACPKVQYLAVGTRRAGCERFRVPDARYESAGKGQRGDEAWGQEGRDALFRCRAVLAVSAAWSRKEFARPLSLSAARCSALSTLPCLTLL